MRVVPDSNVVVSGLLWLGSYMKGNDVYIDLDGDPISFAWIWGDGTTNRNANTKQTHTYAASSQYSGELTVADNRGGSNTVTVPVRVTSLV